MARTARLGKLALGSVVAGTGVGGMMYYRRLSQNKAITGEESNASQNQEQLQAGLDSIRLSAAAAARRGEAARQAAERAAAPVGPELEFFRFTTCPFCGKVKAFLDYYGIPHVPVEVDPMFKSQLGQMDYKKVPVLRFGGHGGATLVDSDLIVDKLTELVGAGDQLRDVEVQRWRAWCRDSFVRHVTLNINKSLLEAWRGYAYIDDFDTIPLVNKLFLKAVGAPVMYMVAKYKTRPALIAAGELAEGEDVRSVFHRQAEHYIREANICATKPFHGGSKPDLADLDVYGVLQSVRGHEVYDDLLQSTCIAPWVARMDSETGKAARDVVLAV